MKKIKKVVKVIIILAVIVILIPIPSKLKDGGSVEYKAILYTFTKYNRLTEILGKKETGWKLEILGKKVYEKLNDNVEIYTKDIDKPNGYYVIDVNDKKVLIDVKNKKYKELYTFLTNDVKYFGEYDNKHYFGSHMQLKYYSLDDNQEHLWLEVDEVGNCRNEIEPSFCSKLFIVSKGVVIGDSLYYHIASDAIGGENNYLFKLKLNAKSMTERDNIIENTVLTWEVNDAQTHITGKLLAINPEEYEEIDFEYNIATKSLTVK